MIPRSDVMLGYLTHVGMERSENQDYYGYYESEDDAEFARKGRLIIVCDGMGGHAGGEVASRLAVETIISIYSRDPSDNPLESLRRAIEAANRAIWDHATANPALKGMGSTVVSMAIKQGVAYFGHVGDSRTYLVRGGHLHQCTRDHSLVQQMVEEGLLREEEMESHPEKNVILRSLGVKPDVDVELNYAPMQVDDIYCLSTDGLTGLVSKEECRQICLLHKDNPMEGARLLVDLANKYGGYDNVTVQIARILTLEPGQKRAPQIPQPQGNEGDVRAAIAQAAAQTENMIQGASKKAAPAKGLTQAFQAPKADDDHAHAAPAAAPAPAPAPAAGGGGKGPLIGIVVVLVLLLGAAIFAMTSMQKTTSARSRLELTMEEAKKAKLEDAKEYKLAKSALDNASGFVGGIFGASDLETAEKDLQKRIDAAKKTGFFSTGEGEERTAEAPAAEGDADEKKA